MFGSNIRPTKAAGTLWINHWICAICKLVDKFGLYTHHLQNVIADTSKQLDWATLQAKFNTLIEPNVILSAAFLLDVLTQTKSSVCTNRNLIQIWLTFLVLKSTKCNNVKLWKKMENDPEFVFTLTTLASMISKVKKDNSKESCLYQD